MIHAKHYRLTKGEFTGKTCERDKNCYFEYGSWKIRRKVKSMYYSRNFRLWTLKSNPKVCEPGKQFSKVLQRCIYQWKNEEHRSIMTAKTHSGCQPLSFLAAHILSPMTHYIQLINYEIWLVKLTSLRKV